VTVFYDGIRAGVYHRTEMEAIVKDERESTVDVCGICIAECW
jgi:hypothetical protein